MRSVCEYGMRILYANNVRIIFCNLYGLLSNFFIIDLYSIKKSRLKCCSIKITIEMVKWVKQSLAMILKKFAQLIIFMINLVVDVYLIASKHDKDFNQSITNNKNQSTNEMVYTNLWTKIELIKTICGQLCDTDTTKHKSISVNDNFHYIPLKKEVNCLNIWNEYK